MPEVTETESSEVASRGEGVGNGEKLINGHRISLSQDEKVLVHHSQPSAGRAFGATFYKRNSPYS